MLIEYKIKFEKDGVAIAQCIDPNYASPNSFAKQTSRVPVNSLPAARHLVAAATPNNPLPVTADGATGPGDETTGPGDETTGPGDETTGPGDETTGFNRFGSAPTFIIGPIVFANARPVEERDSKELEKPKHVPKAHSAKAGN